MKNLLILVTLMSSCDIVAEASHRCSRIAANSDCCRSNDNCKPSACGMTSGGSQTCSSTRWYKAKDGTFREMMPYTAALSRAEDADDMEIQLRGVHEELATVKTNIDTIQADAAQLKTELESRIAVLTQQLESERQAVAGISSSRV